MKFTEFKNKCEKRASEYDMSIGRTHNRDAIGHWVRLASHYVAFPIYKAGIKGQTVLFVHFGCDLVALICVLAGKPLIALFFWATGHFLDNIDGTIARIRGESDPKWGEIDIHLHLIANMIFWVILGVQADMGLQVMMLLAARVVCESHRNEKQYSERWGEKSRLWYWLALPTNVNIVYIGYVTFALLGAHEVYVVLYMTYYYSIALGQSLNKCLK